MTDNGNLGLIRYDAMCRAIMECHRIDEAHQLRSKARALEVYAKQARNFDAETKCAQIRIRAEQRGGDLLKEMERNGERAGQGGDRKSKSADTTLKDLGITRDQSSKWQKLAEIPQDRFEAILTAPGPPPTTDGVLAKYFQRKPLVDLQGRNPADFKQATVIPGWIAELLRLAKDCQPEAVARGLRPHEYAEARRKLAAALAWLERLKAELEKLE